MTDKIKESIVAKNASTIENSKLSISGMSDREESEFANIKDSIVADKDSRIINSHVDIKRNDTSGWMKNLLITAIGGALASGIVYFLQYLFT